MLEKNVKMDTSEYVSEIRKMIEQGYEVTVPVVGWSMHPFLRNEKDRVLLKKPEEPLKTGDIVFYQRESGKYVLHRIYKKRSDGYYMAGDHLLELEGPLSEDAIFAKVIEVERNNRWISTDVWFWKLGSHLWRIVFPFRKISYEMKKAIKK